MAAFPSRKRAASFSGCYTKLEERLNEEIAHPVFDYKVSYKRCIELQVRLCAKYLTGEIAEYPPFLVR